MTERRYGRKSLFDVFRSAEPSPEEPARTGFSLDAFYRARGERAAEALPAIPIRAGLAPVETSEVGSGQVLGVAQTPPPSPLVHHALRIDGAVRVRTYACLAWQRSFCTTCSERCPQGAIVVEMGRPRVDEARCDGCGVCVGVCPAPVNGFDIVPNEREQA